MPKKSFNHGSLVRYFLPGNDNLLNLYVFNGDNNEPYGARVCVPNGTVMLYIGKLVSKPYNQYDVVEIKKNKPHVVHKVLFPEIGQFLYIENNFLKRAKLCR